MTKLKSFWHPYRLYKRKKPNSRVYAEQMPEEIQLLNC